MTSEEEQAYEDALDASDWQVPPYGREYRAGAAALGGLLGMAEAIRYRARPKCGLCGDVQRPDCCDPFTWSGRDRGSDKSTGTP